MLCEQVFIKLHKLLNFLLLSNVVSLVMAKQRTMCTDSLSVIHTDQVRGSTMLLAHVKLRRFGQR
jgi:hypothetical protein